MMSLTTVYFCTILNVVVTQVYVPARHDSYAAYETKYAPEYTNYKPKDYAFKYGVSDPRTGDHKSQWEKRENGVTVGMYSLLEPDGSKRVVEYVADTLHGFRALVKKIPIHPHQLPIVYSAGYNIVPQERPKEDSNVQNEKTTHEAVVSHDNESIEEEDDNEKQEGPINKDTEDVDTHRKENEESEEDSGYTNDDHENGKNEDDDDDSFSYSSYKSYGDDEDEE